MQCAVNLVGEHFHTYLALLLDLYNAMIVHCLNTDFFTLQQIVHIMMSRIGANMEVAPRLFDLQLQHLYSAEAYWLMPGSSITDIISGYTSRHPPNEWK